MDTSDSGILYLVATPIGNLQDVSARLRETLARCQLIAAEDTRTARKLLSACGIKGKQLLSVRQHNERSGAAAIAGKHAGAEIAYVSDAGSPGVSDPGAKLAAHLRERGFRIVPVPGPSAVTAAVSVAGFDAEGYVFAGFLPRGKQARVERLRVCASLGLPVAFFEAPTRIAATLASVAEALGDDTLVCAAREITKLHEQIRVGTSGELLDIFAREPAPLKGEFTFVIEPCPPMARPMADALRAAKLLGEEMPPAKAAKIAAKIANVDARELYRLLDQTRKDA